MPLKNASAWSCSIGWQLLPHTESSEEKVRLAVLPQGMQILQEIIELGLRNLRWREGRHGAEAVAYLKALQEFWQRLIVQSRS